MGAAEETTIYHSALGIIELSARGGRLVRVKLCGAAGGRVTARPRGCASAGPVGCVHFLEEYFAGRQPPAPWGRLDLSAATDFQRKVYEAVLGTGFGEVTTYSETAARAGGTARAVGQALGANPTPIFIPCHRVIASGMRLCGFSAGLAWKERLLSHEGWRIEGGRLAGRF